MILKANRIHKTSKTRFALLILKLIYLKTKDKVIKDNLGRKACTFS